MRRKKAYEAFVTEENERINQGYLKIPILSNYTTSKNNDVRASS